MYVKKQSVAVTTDASGDVTAYTTNPVSGRVLAIRYTPDGSSPLDTGADITVTGETSGLAVVTKANIGTSAFTLAPRQPIHLNTDGSAALHAAGGTALLDHVYLPNERVKFVIAQGGNAKSGTFTVIHD